MRPLRVCLCLFSQNPGMCGRRGQSALSAYGGASWEVRTPNFGLLTLSTVKVRDGSGIVRVLVSFCTLGSLSQLQDQKSILFARVLSEDLTLNPSPFVCIWQARFISRSLNWVFLSPPELFSIVFLCLVPFYFHLKIKLRLCEHQIWVMGQNTHTGAFVYWRNIWYKK